MRFKFPRLVRFFKLARREQKKLTVHVRTMTLRGLSVVLAGYRKLFKDTVFIGITGSCGKTSTKEMMLAALKVRYQGKANRDTRNSLAEIIRTMFRVRSSDDFCIQEFGVSGLGEAIPLQQQLNMFKPQIGVITNIGSDHISAYGSKEAIAAEKSKLISSLPASGVAILNADDDLVLGMRHQCRGRVLTYGLKNDAMVTATNVESKWPQRLAFTLQYQGQSCRVQTQLCGKHWISCALAAAAVAVEMKLSLEEIAQGFASLQPVTARMSPHVMPNGVTFIRDDWKAPIWTVASSLEFMRDATARRRIIVIGTLSDYRGDAASKYVKVAREARDSADFVIFVGPWASRALRARRHSGDDSIRAVPNVQELIPLLKEFLEPGDLVLLKGSHAADFLVKVIPAVKHHDLEENLQRNAAKVAAAEAEANRREDSEHEQDTQYIIGMGNPGEEYSGTPHNVGYAVLDRLAADLGGEWRRSNNATIARVTCHDQTLCLVKPNAEMNGIGPQLAKLQESESFSPDDLIIVQDDLQLDIGRLKTRMKGSAGGHKGVASVIGTFQSELIRRVKVGVGKPENKGDVVDYVLSPFAAGVRNDVDAAYEKAAERVKDLVKQSASVRRPR